MPKKGRLGLPGEGKDLEDYFSADEVKEQTVREEQTTEQFSISNADGDDDEDDDLDEDFFGAHPDSY